MRFFTFFGPLDAYGITPGMRIEIGLVIIASFIYFQLKSQSVLRSLFFSFLTYALIFTYCAMPFVVSFIIPGIEEAEILPILTYFFLLLIFILGYWLFYLHQKGYFIEILKDLRPLRLVHFELMFVLGVILAGGINFKGLFGLLSIMIAILFAWLFSVMTNNQEDVEIDKVANASRPSVTMKIPAEDYKKLSWIFLSLAILYSLANFQSLFLVILFIGLYFIYSMPPIRLKRLPFFSKLAISFSSLVLVILGYNFVTDGINIPGKVIVFFLICFTAVINFIDIKDYEGDAKAGIKTLPVLLGLKKAKLLIGLFFLISYLLVPVIWRDMVLLLPAILLGILEFFLLNRKNYDERLVFIVYLVSLTMLIVYIAVYL